jgi:hypothetical protein
MQKIKVDKEKNKLPYDLNDGPHIHNINEILLKVALNTITLIYLF